MPERFAHFAGAIAVAALVTFLLRALPFILFAGKGRALPPAVERLGALVSPVIIAGLIAYSYYGLYRADGFDPSRDWAWPILAGVLTVALQLWKGNPLASILAGTVLYMCLLSCGCATSRAIELDAKNPAVRVSLRGVLFDGTFVTAEEVPERLTDYAVPKDRVIHILLDADVRDLRPARLVMAHLRKAGYTRPVLVTKRHADSFVTDRKAKSSAGGASGGVAPKVRPAKKVRYKSAGEG